MAKYMIHACNQRYWYVDKYLIPSMLEQGIKEEDIILFLDTEEAGNLAACLSSFSLIKDLDIAEDGIWHLQDDVIISSDFKKRTEELDSGLVCGFCCDFDANKDLVGETTIINMWYSFPCIRIPNKFAIEFIEWYYNGMSSRTEVNFFSRNNKNDDLLFRAFLERHYMNSKVLLAVPNLVDHIDYLIGGSTINKQRKQKIVKSNYFDEPELIDRLRLKLQSDC